MIRQGKTQGWLSQPVHNLKEWASLTQTSFRGIEVGPLDAVEEKGSGIKVIASELAAEQNPLMIVPAELILSKGNIELHAKSDKHLRDVLDAVGAFGKVGLVPYMWLMIYTDKLQDSSWCYTSVHVDPGNPKLS